MSSLEFKCDYFMRNHCGAQLLRIAYFSFQPRSDFDPDLPSQFYLIDLLIATTLARIFTSTRLLPQHLSSATTGLL